MSLRGAKRRGNPYKTWIASRHPLPATLRSRLKAHALAAEGGYARNDEYYSKQVNKSSYPR